MSSTAQVDHISPADNKLRRAGWYAAFGLIPFGTSIPGLIIILLDRVRVLFSRHNSASQPTMNPSPARWAHRLMLALLASVLLSSALSSRPGVAFLCDIGFFLAIYALFYGAVELGRHAPEDLYRRYLPVLVIAGTGACIVSLIRYFAFPETLRIHEYRAVNLFTGRNGLGTNMIFLGGLGLAFLMHRGSKWRRLLLPLLGLVCLTLLSSRSRGAWFGFAGMLSTLCALNRRYLVVLFAVTLIMCLAFAVSPLFRERLGEAVSLEANTNRLWIWQSSWNMILKNPLVGVGTGVYSLVFGNYAVEDAKNWRPPFAHNIFLQVCAEFGLIGLVIFTTFLILILYMSLVLARTGNLIYQGLFAVLIGILIHQQVDCTVWGIDVGGSFWMLLGLVVGSYTHEKTRGILAGRSVDTTAGQLQTIET